MISRQRTSTLTDPRFPDPTLFRPWGARGQRTPEAISFPDAVYASVERVWQLVPGAGDDEVYAGTEPAAVWHSTDRGETFSLVRGLWDHPHRTEWAAGFGGQAFHTVLPHPTRTGSVLAALSTGGVYASDDNGASWQDRKSTRLNSSH